MVFRVVRLFFCLAGDELRVLGRSVERGDVYKGQCQAFGSVGSHVKRSAC